MTQQVERKKALREKQALEYFRFETSSCGASPDCTDVFNCPFERCLEEDKQAQGRQQASQRQDSAQAIRELHAQGLSIEAISVQLGVSLRTVYRKLNR